MEEKEAEREGRVFSFQGMMAPVFTPMNADGSLKLEIVSSYAAYLSSRGVNGVYVGGTVGEGISLTVPERKLLTEAWMAAASSSNLSVIAMVGAAGLKDTQELAKHAESVGVSGIASLPGLYDKPKTVTDLVDYCHDIASAAPKTPFFYYHIPFKTDVNLPMDEFLRLGETKIRTLCGIKFTSLDVAGQGFRCLQISSGKFTIFSGFDDTLCEALLLGYKSAINCCFNFLPVESKVIFDCVEEYRKAMKEWKEDEERKEGKERKEEDEEDTEKKEVKERKEDTEEGKEEDEKEGAAGRWREKAQEQQRRVTGILESVFAFTGGFSVSGAKCAMTLLTGLDVGPPRRPLRPLSDADKRAMTSSLSALIRP